MEARIIGREVGTLQCKMLEKVVEMSVERMDPPSLHLFHKNHFHFYMRAVIWLTLKRRHLGSSFHVVFCKTFRAILHPSSVITEAHHL